MLRRSFVKNVALSAAAVAAAPLAKATPASQPLGVQLWTIRSYLQNDLVGSLTRLAQLGYNEVELFDYDGTYWGKQPKEFSKICSDAGLKIISSHYMTGRHDGGKLPGTLLNGWQKAVDDSAEMGVPYMICAWLYKEERTSLDLYKQLAGMLNKAGETCRKSNIQLGYHSHNFEFPPINGVVPYDFLLQNTDENLVKMEADLFWIIKAGINPVDYFNKYPGRFPLWHVKDMERGSEQFAELGRGIIDFDPIFAARKTAGLQHWFVEQDQSTRDLFESLTISKAYVIKKNYWLG